MNTTRHLTPSEQCRFDQIRYALVAFDEADQPGAKDKAYETLVSLIPGLTHSDVRDYWESESEDDFAWRHAIEKIAQLGSDQEQQRIVALALSLRHFTSLDDVHLFDLLIYRHGDAFEQLYGTPTGTFHETLSADNVVGYDDFIIAMKRQGPIRL